MILEFIMDSLKRYEMVKTMTNNIYYKTLWNRNENNYIINKWYRFNNKTTQIFSQEKIIQKWTFKRQLQTITTTNIFQDTNTNSTSIESEIEIQLSLVYKLKMNNWNTTVDVSINTIRTKIVMQY